MAKPNVEIATNTNRTDVVQTITLGFSADPIARWFWPDGSTYLETMPKFVEAFGGKAIENNSAYYVAKCKAAALWLPPGVEPDGEMI